ncbi:hypothetical protein I3760_02G087700 [Carya illinoinensis]|nr:hypothetical protein I3760_02G087700 [Carya illinoinensis]KAG2721560.1 hypothetical protein I3760_02G087700 [Carya illinoinensis]KAG2721566.1 hypothetical protein I3760_02G087700 [Carya illinoinensis]KAG2721567.1 hypothetical protein I3760_02G087700 [Carya illinoinensis]KAG2721568.1 hypothetical protein I3760_02G087700 [Carya illinoinensis]
MVCSLGSGRMAAMARLLVAGSFSQTMADEVGHRKLSAQYICRELCEAVEANLLDEEDMHVFGLKPMAEPLQLVCCNACKKPIKASQYAAHAEICRSLNSVEETTLEFDGSAVNRKLPKKERKKLLTAYSNQATPIGGKDKSESVDANNSAVSESHLDNQAGIASCAKRNSACMDVASMTDVSGVGPGNKDNPACLMPPPAKRSKPIAAGCLLLSSDSEAVPGVKKITSTADAFPYAPVPLATKIYYSQRTYRHRTELTHLYCEASTKELCSDMVSSKNLRENMIPLQVSTPREPSGEPMEDTLTRKRHTYTLSSVRSPDQILAQSSEVCLGKTGGFLSTSDFPNQHPVDNVLRPEASPVGLRSKYISKPYSFAGNSGKPLGTMQQPNGGVPVL